MRAQRVLPILIVLAIGLATAVPKLTGPVPWDGTDPLFYQAQSLELRGAGETQARAEVLDSAPGRITMAVDRRLHPITARQLASPRWRRYSAPMYRRRWVVPAATALLSPLFGDRSQFIVGGIGYLLAGVLLYLLLARRFSPTVSVGVTAVFLLCWPMRHEALTPGTDSWGLAMLLAALLAALTVLQRGMKFLPLWIAIILVASITREDYIVALVAVLWMALRTRAARPAAMVAGGVAAALPVTLLFGTSLSVVLAYVENGYNPPPSTSLSYILTHYWPTFRYTVHSDLTFPQAQGWPLWSSALWYLGMLILLAGVFLLVRRGGTDPFYRLIRGALLGAVAYILISVNYTDLRLELVFVPPLAVSLALLVEWVLDRRRLGSGAWNPGLPVPRVFAQNARH